MVMKALRDGAKGGVSKFILFGFLILATGGLVFMDVGGVFSGGVGGGDVAKIGNQSVSLPAFDQNARRTLQRLGISPQEAYKLGYINQLMATEIRGHILNQSAAQNGVRVPKMEIAKQIQTILLPYTSQGEDAQTVLDQILRNQGMNEIMFVNSIGRDIGNDILTSALSESVSYYSDAIAHDLYAVQNEQRDIEYVVFMSNDVRDIPNLTRRNCADCTRPRKIPSPSPRLAA